MAKQRYINTRFWDDSYIASKDPIEKLLFLYLLTNPLTNIIGIYEVSVRRIAFDTGINKNTVLKILQKFELDGKIKYQNEYVAIKNFIKHQKKNPSIEKGIEMLKSQVPPALLQWVVTGSIQAVTGSIQSPTNLNSNNNSNLNSNSNINNNSSKTKSQKNIHKVKTKYGEFKNVLLTEDEYKKLKDKFGDKTNDLIENLSQGIESKGYKYKNHYATILNWYRRSNGFNGNGQKAASSSGEEDKYNKYNKYDGITEILNTDENTA